MFLREGCLSINRQAVRDSMRRAYLPEQRHSFAEHAIHTRIPSQARHFVAQIDQSVTDSALVASLSAERETLLVKLHCPVVIAKEVRQVAQACQRASHP